MKNTTRLGSRVFGATAADKDRAEKSAMSRRGFVRTCALAGIAAPFVASLNQRAIAQPRSLADGIYGPRIPEKWFWFRGVGTSYMGYGEDPYETFAYDSALRAGRIEDYNVVPYTSVLPKEAKVIPPMIDGENNFVRPDSVVVHPGSVLEVIMSATGMTVPGNSTWTICTALAIQGAAEKGSPNILRNSYAAEYEIVYQSAEDKSAVEAEAIERLTEAVAHELTIRELVQFEGKGPTIHRRADKVPNDKSDNLYAYSITGIGCYEMRFPAV